MRDNVLFAQSKASRFLDTSLKVNELEHRERIYDNEIDEKIEQEENEILEEDFYDSNRPRMRDEEDSMAQMADEMTMSNSEADVTATSNTKKRKTRK